MARINIEDKLMIDPRFILACIKLGDRELAMGIALNFFQVAQKYWCPKMKPIPEKIYRQLRGAELWLEVGLSKRVRGGIYIHGSKANFAWLIQKHDASRKGVESRRNKVTERSPNGDPLTLTLTPTLRNPPTPLRGCGGFNFGNIASDEEILKLHEIFPTRPEGKPSTQTFKKLVFKHCKHRSEFENLLTSCAALSSEGREAKFNPTLKSFLENDSWKNPPKPQENGSAIRKR